MASTGVVHHSVGGVYATRDVLAVEKGVSAAVMATIERGRPFIDVDVARRGGKIAREEARSGGNTRWRVNDADETFRLPFIAIKEMLRHFVHVSLKR
jgi:hypothetical protein